MANYEVVNGVPKGAGADLYAQGMTTQEAHNLANIEHQSNVSGDAIIRHVSDRPVKAPRAYQWYATKQDLINRGFPTYKGKPFPVTIEQAKQEGYADHQDYRVSGKGEYHRFFNYTESNLSKNTTAWVLEAQKIYRQATGKPTFAWHGCNGSMCPQWHQRTGKLISNVKTYNRRKLKEQTPVETSKTMLEGMPRPKKKPDPVFVPKIPEPEPEPVETVRNTSGLIVGIAVIAVIIYILFRRRK